MPTDRYARMRHNLMVYRTTTDYARSLDATPWCRECETHLADDSGLCPVCAPASAA